MVYRSANPPPNQPNRRWRNWSGEQDYVVEDYYEPTTLEELVWVVEQAHEQGVRLKAVGSGPEKFDAAIEENQTAHQAAGHWGVPLMVFEGEPFYGQDRIDLLVWRMRRKGP